VTETTIAAAWDIVLTQSALATILEQVLRGDSDVGGVLVGRLFRCPTSGRRWVRADSVWRSTVSLSEACDARALTAALGPAAFDADDSTLVRVGWYHSHARVGVTLTESESRFHEREFSKPWQFALILVARSDPAGGVFQRGPGGVFSRTAYAPFYELPRTVRSDGSRQTMIHWQNYTTDNRVHLIDPTSLRDLASGQARSGSAGVLPPRLGGPATRPRRSRGETPDSREDLVWMTGDDGLDAPATGSRRSRGRGVIVTVVAAAALFLAGWYGWERLGPSLGPALEFSAPTEADASGLDRSEPPSPEAAFLSAMTSLGSALDAYARLEGPPEASCDALASGLSRAERDFRAAAMAYAALSLATPGDGRAEYEAAALRVVDVSSHFSGSGCDRP
jgi:proteasome lid subunit RPN8/RPN11